MRRALLLLALPILLAGCVYPRVNRELNFFSLPSGAEVVVDGAGTGEYTPCTIDFGLFAGRRLIEFRKPGFKSEKRRILRRTELGMSRPSQAASDLELMILNPAFWTFEDVLLPIKIESGVYPHNIFVRLQPEPGS